MERAMTDVYVSMEEGGTLVSCIRPLTGISVKDSWRWYQCIRPLTLVSVWVRTWIDDRLETGLEGDSYK